MNFREFKKTDPFYKECSIFEQSIFFPFVENKEIDNMFFDLAKEAVLKYRSQVSQSSVEKL